MNLNEIITDKPHLREILGLYENVLHFREATFSISQKLDGVYSNEELEEITDIFSESFFVEREALQPLKEAIMEGEIDLQQVPFLDLGSLSLPYTKEEVAPLLFLMSKPYFISLGLRFNVENTFWLEGKCPVCNASPSVSILAKGKERKFYCSFCEVKGHWKRIGCPHCMTENPKDITIMIFQEEKGMRADICQQCNSYYKTFDREMLNTYDFDILDIISLALDVACWEQGFIRQSPNPLGQTGMIL